MSNTTNSSPKQPAQKCGNFVLLTVGPTISLFKYAPKEKQFNKPNQEKRWTANWFLINWLDSQRTDNNARTVPKMSAND